jgi:hypothetical protein
VKVYASLIKPRFANTIVRFVILVSTLDSLIPVL